MPAAITVPRSASQSGNSLIAESMRSSALIWTALVALLRDDATMSMPPIPGWLRGAPAIAQFWRGRGSACRGSRMAANLANGLPAFGFVATTPSSSYEAFAIQVIEIADGRITGLHTFLEPRLFPLLHRSPTAWT